MVSSSLGSEASLIEAWTEVHLVDEVLQDQVEQLSGGEASDSFSEGVDSRIKVDNDLECDEDWHLNPHAGAHWVGHHLRDAAIVHSVAFSGLCIDPFHASRRIEVGAEGLQHESGHVHRSIDVDRDCVSGGVASDCRELWEDAPATAAEGVLANDW